MCEQYRVRVVLAVNCFAVLTNSDNLNVRTHNVTNFVSHCDMCLCVIISLKKSPMRKIFSWYNNGTKGTNYLQIKLK
jgi:hypothetical protein